MECNSSEMQGIARAASSWRTESSVCRTLRSVSDLQTYLQPVSLSPEDTVEYRLPGFKSRLTMELLQVRLRKQSQVFGVDRRLVPANVDWDGRRARIHMARMTSVNDAVGSRILVDPGYQILLLRALHRTAAELAEAAAAFEAASLTDSLGFEGALRFVDVATSYQELGALKFCFPHEEVRGRFLRLMNGDETSVDDLFLAPGASLLNRLRRAQLRLAAMRLNDDRASYQAALADYRSHFGFLEAEDMDFRQFDTEDYVNEKIATLCAQHGEQPSSISKQIERMEATADTQRRAQHLAMQALLRRLHRKQTDRIWYLNALHLVRAMVHHEDANRFHKMRLLKALDGLCRDQNRSSFEASLSEVLRSLRRKVRTLK